MSEETYKLNYQNPQAHQFDANLLFAVQTKYACYFTDKPIPAQPLRKCSSISNLSDLFPSRKNSLNDAGRSFSTSRLILDVVNALDIDNLNQNPQQLKNALRKMSTDYQKMEKSKEFDFIDKHSFQHEKENPISVLSQPGQGKDVRQIPEFKILSPQKQDQFQEKGGEQSEKDQKDQQYEDEQIQLPPPPYYDNYMYENQEYNENSNYYYEPYFFQVSDQDLKNIIKNSHLLVKDQMGCRLIQQKLEERNPELCEMIISNLIPNVAILTCDPFGNYLIQKLIDSVSQDQIGDIIDQMRGHIADASLNPHGTRVVQKLIGILQREQHINKVIQDIQSWVPTLAADLNGNHVLQRILSTLQPQHNQFIYDAVIKQIMEIASHRHGCCVIQQCIDCASQQQLFQLVNVIVSNAVQLVKDAYGNYVIQHVLDLQQVEINNRIAHVFMPYIIDLSRQKFSSNVIEKCLMSCTQDVQQLMMHEITKAEFLGIMLNDQYGNYVVQKVMNIAPKQLLQIIFRDIRPHLEGLKKTKNGKRVYTKLCKRYPQLIIKNKWECDYHPCSF